MDLACVDITSDEVQDQRAQCDDTKLSLVCERQLQIKRITRCWYQSAPACFACSCGTVLVIDHQHTSLGATDGANGLHAECGCRVVVLIACTVHFVCQCVCLDMSSGDTVPWAHVTQK